MLLIYWATPIEQQERQQEALTYQERAISISPNNPDYMDSMGLLLFRMGNLNESLDWLEKAYSIQPRPGIAMHSRVLSAQGNTTKLWYYQRSNS